VTGLGDLVILEPIENGVRTRVLEVKTAWKDKTAHQVQAAIYSILIDQVVSNLGFEHEPLATVINREADLRETTLDELKYIDRNSRTVEVR
jgi:predicted RecB family nuclease